MKKIFLAVATALAMFSCSQKEPVTVTITNPLSIDRNGEMVEISMAEITGKLQLPDTAQVIQFVLLQFDSQNMKTMF